MIESVQFKNFKVLRDVTLPLSQFTLIVGPNGSGKSTALQALKAVVHPENFKFGNLVTAGLQPMDGEVEVEVVQLLSRLQAAFPPGPEASRWTTGRQP